MKKKQTSLSCTQNILHFNYVTRMILLKAIQCCYLYEVWNLCTQVIDRWLSKICRRTVKCSYIFFHSRTSLRKETSIKVIHTPQEHYEDSFHCLFIEIDAVHRKLIIDYGVIFILCDIFATHYIRIHIFANTSTTHIWRRTKSTTYQLSKCQRTEILSHFLQCL